MGVLRLFSRIGQNFTRGGGKHYIKIIIYIKKVKQNILFCPSKRGRGGGAGGGIKSPLLHSRAEAIALRPFQGDSGGPLFRYKIRPRIPGNHLAKTEL